METLSGNLLADIPVRSKDEVVTTLLSRAEGRIERIVSTGQVSPADFWYDQAWAEWVIVMSGGATLQFADTDELYRMGRGDYAFIAPHRLHRVAWTDPNVPTVWLAIHFGGGPAVG
ncbi:cupin domain-containing protein [Telmatospirillum sp.]|uniref:cupin domain-containing protein n=1 Tax=Telmatospirillum sp. TaxID=2079197 RepID=UPI0028407FF3|nr:cupin domain-containing protein [Telmatospirillum sp.]MDR3439788.1 cupin domain-containing protein [Telmatospirillum sp.]